jgi:hypothetical protein
MVRKNDTYVRCGAPDLGVISIETEDPTKT